MLDKKGVLRVRGRLQICSVMSQNMLQYYQSRIRLLNYLFVKRTQIHDMEDYLKSSKNVSPHVSSSQGHHTATNVPIISCSIKTYTCSTHIAFDYAGPFCFKFSLVRVAKSIKSYLATFVCMMVRAVHVKVILLLLIVKSRKRNY